MASLMLADLYRVPLAARRTSKPGKRRGELAEKPPRQSRMVGEDDSLRW